MASEKTLLKTIAILNRLTRILGPFAKEALPVMFDAKGKIITKWEGGGDLVKRRKHGPGIFERIYRELPQRTRQEFMILTSAPTTPPTKDEFEEFERRLLTATRRVANREITKILSRLPDPTKKPRGRPRRKQEKVELVQRTVEELEKKMSKVAAVREAARVLGEGGTPLHEDTIWRYLRVSQVRRTRPRSVIAS
jgi:hypothetical protein